MFKSILIVALGSGVGGALRFVLSKWIQESVATSFPVATMVINVMGCLLIGLFYGIFDRSSFLGSDIKLLLTVGLCGGFTTFSTFMNENFQLLRMENYFYSALYAAGSLFLGLLAVFVGYQLIKQI
jgi:fluoride exporter